MKFIINLCLLAGICFTLAACTEIYFTEPQPKWKKALENGFKDLMGEYLSIDDSGNKDTIVVTKDRIIFPDEESMEDELGEIFIVKKHRGYYFLNFYDDDKDLWLVIVIEQINDDSLHVTNLLALEENRAGDLLELGYGKKVIPDDDDDDEYIVLNPSRRNLLKLVRDPLFDENRTFLRKIKNN